MGVYSRFGGKDGIVEVLFKEGFDRLGQAFAVARTGSDPLGALMAIGQAYRRVALEHPTSYTIMFERAVPDYTPSADALSHALETHGQLVAAVERAINAGMIAGEAVPVAHALWALCHGLVSLQLHGMSVGVDNEAVFEASVSRHLGALKVSRQVSQRRP